MDPLLDDVEGRPLPISPALPSWQLLPVLRWEVTEGREARPELGLRPGSAMARTRAAGKAWDRLRVTWSTRRREQETGTQGRPGPGAHGRHAACPQFPQGQGPREEQRPSRRARWPRWWRLALYAQARPGPAWPQVAWKRRGERRPPSLDGLHRPSLKVKHLGLLLLPEGEAAVDVATDVLAVEAAPLGARAQLRRSGLGATAWNSGVWRGPKGGQA